MGADLSHGTVENDRVVCPFHHWQYDAGGNCCVEIPYRKRIPYRGPGQRLRRLLQLGAAQIASGLRLGT